jgi:hypothetical protein
VQLREQGGLGTHHDRERSVARGLRRPCNRRIGEGDTLGGDLERKADVHGFGRVDLGNELFGDRLDVADQQVVVQRIGDINSPRTEEIGRRVWRRLVERYPNVLFPITLPAP